MKNAEFEDLMNVAADPNWRGEHLGVSDEMFAGEMEVSAEIYAACFNTHAGRAVLADLNKMFATRTRWYPGEDPTSGFYREGAAQVVYHLAAKLEEHANATPDEPP